MKMIDTTSYPILKTFMPCRETSLDMTKKKSFPIFLQDCNYCEGTHTRFLDESRLEMTFDHKVVVFDLEGMRYSIGEEANP